ncbi:DNA cytosine methyltransferase [Bergeyella zoohelcum]|uniref:Cytosine-specific methyltransferase n=1 Tax=Bergeyella zoohelcum TaxID=1015 RepID=A0A7Z8YLY0_9FLAO|nr:DNA cytosine methyltransferase [Bergeyella zoohelcum]VDH03024.1 cytosine-specific methyltransferase NlaX [Bergeyella zoohelcum]
MNKKITFIDLFAGIGGFHQAMKNANAQCVFACEWDKYAVDTYTQNYGITPFGDITQIDEKKIPPHDILCAGFPCQAFSISGKQKGFEDIRGTLFFDIVRIVNHHKPHVVFLENVKNLAKHDKGNTLKVILNTLAELGYKVHYQILNTSNFGLPQNRERIYFVAFHHSIDSEKFQFPQPLNKRVALKDFLENNPKDGKIIERNDIEIYKQYQVPTDLFGKANYLNKPIQIGKVNKGGQGERIYHPEGHAITLSAYGGGVGAKTGLYLINGKVRKLSPRECARIQGFPDDFIINNSITQAYKQFGNSVSVDVLKAITKEIMDVLIDNKQQQK